MARLWHVVARICRKQFNDPADAEDATQETFNELLRADHSRILSIEPWLTKVALRVCQRIHRSRYRSREVPLADTEVVHAVHGPEQVAVSSSTYAVLRRHLVPSDYEVLIRRHVLGWTYQSIGDRLGLSADSTRVKAHRARRRAQAALASADVELVGRVRRNSTDRQASR